MDEQTKVITAKQANVREDLAGVEPAVIEAQQGTANEIFILKLTVMKNSIGLKSFRFCLCFARMERGIMLDVLNMKFFL